MDWVDRQVGTQASWRTLAQALCVAQRAERRHGYQSAHYQEAYRAYLVALSHYQTTATQQAARAARDAGF